MTDMAALNARSHTLRGSRRDWRRDLRAGRVTPQHALTQRPAALAALPVVDVPRMARGIGPARLHQLGRDAAEAGVNLLVPLGRASEGTVGWLVAWLDARPSRWDAGRAAGTRLQWERRRQAA